MKSHSGAVLEHDSRKVSRPVSAMAPLESLCSQESDFVRLPGDHLICRKPLHLAQ